MSKAYDDFIENNICPWCDRSLHDVDHSAGCPGPYVETERGRRIKEFLKVLLRPRPKFGGDK